MFMQQQHIEHPYGLGYGYPSKGGMFLYVG